MMPSFRSPKNQASHAVATLSAIGQARHTSRNDGLIHSLGTSRNYAQALSQCAGWLRQEHLGDLRSIDRETAELYLAQRAGEVRQSQLDQDRQALQALIGERMPRTKSELETIRTTRAYTPEQLSMIREHQSPRNAIATELAERCGLRAHEMLTIRPAAEQPRSEHRQWRNDTHQGREGERWTVIGKGGLIREVLVPHDLAARLQEYRLEKSETVTDRGIRYASNYAIGGGQAWSASFSAASQRALGWSQGGHGARHTYAQTRMEELQERGLTEKDCREVISLELGHFRADVVDFYMR